MGHHTPEKRREQDAQEKTGRQGGGQRVGIAAAHAGVGVQTLHYYEREGLIEAPARTAAGYRLYSREMVHRVRAIKRAQSALAIYNRVLGAT